MLKVEMVMLLYLEQLHQQAAVAAALIPLVIRAMMAVQVAAVADLALVQVQAARHLLLGKVTLAV
jgi:hypothetical protein